MRNVNLEAAIWYLFTSTEFFEAAGRECEQTMEWIGSLAVSKGVVNFGRNNQVFDALKRLGRNFSRGAELARLGDYELIWETSSSVAGNVRGMMEQQLQSWMTEAQYQEFSDVKISRLMTYAGQIESALNNAIAGADAYFDTDPDGADQRNDDDGFPGDTIVKWYNSYIKFYKTPLYWDLPSPLPEYATDTSIACKTGDEVPWTGVWYPSTGLNRHSLTFAIKGMRMQPVYQVIKTTEELRTEECMFPQPETLAVETTWHPLKPAVSILPASGELWSKQGEPCPRTGVWQPTDPGAARRIYTAGEPMASLGSAFGLTVWRWVADR